MKHHSILHFLFVPGLTAILLIGGLGVENQQNGLRVIYLCWAGPKSKDTDRNERKNKPDEIKQ
jgi:hypothetical protein